MSLVDIVYQCPLCGHTNYDEVENVIIDHTQPDGVSDSEPQLTEVVCAGSCRHQFTIEVSVSYGWRTIKLVGYSAEQTGISFESTPFGGEYSSYDDFLENYVPDDAHDVYAVSMGEAKLLEEGIKNPGVRDKTLLKLIYLQYVMILEAYLSDRLINMIMEDTEKMLAVISRIGTLQQPTHSLIQFLKDPDYVKKTVKVSLQTVSFHDLMKVADLYDAVLSINIFSDVPFPPLIAKKRKDQKNKSLIPLDDLTPVEREMIEIIQIRHHLVHRNGRNNDRDFIDIKKSDVERVRQLVEEMVARVEKAYVGYFANRAFGDLSHIKF
ncbi:hypothetical protein [Agrobacterium rosae]|uniref:hypothetical protein n=1 Tax=Agrobacterium rosae TaxID=1972867 RepID=UPI0020335D18|nr:hypothetical protein [Agrobacterium rosae]MCM2433197.1 hypothetical protein [Agrobacterium rosae]